MRPGPARSALPLPASRESPLRRRAWQLTWVIITPREEYCQVPATTTNGEPFGSPFESGRRDLTRPAASAAGAGLSPASGAKAPQAPKLNPRPPDAEPARSAGGADVVGWGSAGASTPCESLEGRVTTSSSDHAMFWASVS